MRDCSRLEWSCFRKDGEMKEIEEIRIAHMMTQAEFAKTIGMSSRTYQARIYGEQPMFKIEELQRISEMNDNEVVVNLPQGKFNITFTKVD